MSEQQATQAEEQTPVIGLAGKRKWGYKVSQVDDFLVQARDLYEQPEPRLTQEEIQLQSFDLERNGYIIGQVDATLIRLEKAVVDKRTEWDLQHQGHDVWNQQTRTFALTLQQRAELQPKSRFKLGEKRTASYDRKQVDSLVDQAWSHISKELGLSTSQRGDVKGADEVSAAQVSNVIFTQRRGKRGYDEASVDAYLNRIIQVLTRMESIVRVSAGSDNGLENPAQSEQAGAADSTELPTLSRLLNNSSDAEPATAAAPLIPPTDSHDSDQSVGERTVAFSPLDDLQAAAVRDEESVTANEAETPQTTSLAGLVHTHEPQDLTQAPEPTVVPPSFAPGGSEQTPAAQRPAQTAPVSPTPQPAANEPVASPVSDEAPVEPVPSKPNESSTPSEQSDADATANPDEYISSVLSHTSVQTSSFEIPNLTFPFGEDGGNAGENLGAASDSESQKGEKKDSHSNGNSDE
jgi:DivIVA domain-containing protein